MHDHSEQLPEVHVLDHPVARTMVGQLRDPSTRPPLFRQLAAELASILAWEATRDLTTEDQEIEIWSGSTTIKRLCHIPTVVPILRAGLGMIDGVLRLMPEAPVSVLGMYRDEDTLQPVAYYDGLVTDIAARPALLVDPMLATGGSAVAAIQQLKEAGCTDIRALFLLSAPEGVSAVHSAHPDVPVYTAALDVGLNDRGYILPGLGDAGDRLFGTEE